MFRESSKKLNEDSEGATSDNTPELSIEHKTEEKIGGKWNNPFVGLSSEAIAIRFKELDQCCCADVPCISIVKEYCESSSLHGLRYITENGRHWSERVLWVVLCLLGFILTVYFIIPIWIKWHLKPTLTTLDSTNHPIWKIDFPGVTVCPTNKAIKIKLDQIIDREPWKSEFVIHGTTTEDLKRLIELMVHLEDYETIRKDYTDLQDMFDRIGQRNLTNLMVNVMPKCEEYILRCWWKGKLEDCNELFQIRKTDNGFCCSFNTIGPTETLDTSSLKSKYETVNDDWVNQYYDNDSGNETIVEETYSDFEYEDLNLPSLVPNFLLDYNDLDSGRQGNYHGRKPLTRSPIKRQNSASPRRGLSMLLDAGAEEYFVTSDNFIGFKILVHDPRAFPEVNGRALVVGPKREFFMTVTASHTEGSDSIRKLPIERRNCLFSDERDIKESEVSVFKVYSQENCFLECRAKHLLQKCGCLPYYYPPLDVIFRNQNEFQHLNSTCDWVGWNCLANSTQLLEAIDPHAAPYNSSWKGGAACNCPPACTRTDYSAAQSFGDFPNKASYSFHLVNNEKGNNLMDLTLVHVFFRELKMFKYTTDELFSWNDILASFGGLVGLCTGFSFLSLAELVYFFTLRCTLPLCRMRRKDKVATLNNADLVVVQVDEQDNDDEDEINKNK